MSAPPSGLKEGLVYVVGLTAFVLGIATTGLLDVADDPAPAADVEIDTEALLDAATISLRGYGPDGTPGTFLYDCEHNGERLICTQRSEP